MAKKKAKQTPKTKVEREEEKRIDKEAELLEMLSWQVAKSCEYIADQLELTGSLSSQVAKVAMALMCGSCHGWCTAMYMEKLKDGPSALRALSARDDDSLDLIERTSTLFLEAGQAIKVRLTETEQN